MTEEEIQEEIDWLMKTIQDIEANPSDQDFDAGLIKNAAFRVSQLCEIFIDNLVKKNGTVPPGTLVHPNLHIRQAAISVTMFLRSLEKLGLIRRP